MEELLEAVHAVLTAEASAPPVIKVAPSSIPLLM